MLRMGVQHRVILGHTTTGVGYCPQRVTKSTCCTNNNLNSHMNSPPPKKTKNKLNCAQIPCQKSNTISGFLENNDHQINQQPTKLRNRMTAVKSWAPASADRRSCACWGPACVTVPSPTSSPSASWLRMLRFSVSRVSFDIKRKEGGWRLEWAGGWERFRCLWGCFRVLFYLYPPRSQGSLPF